MPELTRGSAHAAGIARTIALATGLLALTGAAWSAQLIFSPTTLPNGEILIAYNQTITVTGGVAPYTFVVSNLTNPVPGLTFTSNGAAGTETLGGTPTGTGTMSFTLNVTDNAANTASQNYSLTINPSVSITTTSPLPAGIVNVPGYSQTIGATGGIVPYTFSVSSGSLPTGLNLNTSTGRISGTPTAVGSYSFSIEVIDGVGGSSTMAFQITIVPSFSPSTLPNGEILIAYNQTITVTGGVAPDTFVVSNLTNPVPGLTFTSNGAAGTETVSGTPTGTGTMSFTLNVTDNGANTASQNYSLTINPSVSITTTSPLPSGIVNVPGYSQTIGATGGIGPYTFSVASGSLPTGLNLNSSTGRISGTPTAAGSYSFSIEVTDSVGGSSTMPFQLTIATAASVPSLGTWGLVLLSGLLALFGARALARDPA